MSRPRHTVIAAAAVSLAILLLTPSASFGQSQEAPLRVCVAGLVHGHIEGFLDDAARHPEIRVVAIAETDTALSGSVCRRHHIEGVPVFRSLDEAIGATHPEAVAAFSSTFAHRNIVEVCGKRGIPVMMEKPLAVSLDDALAIARAAEQGHIAVLVNYQTTWYPNTEELHRLIRKGGLGEIRKMVAHHGHRGPREIGVGPEFLSWLTDPVLNGGGALMDFGCYGANLFTYLMNNARPLTVTAVTQHIKPDVYPRVDDEATIIVTYPRAQGIIQASWNWPAGRMDLEIYGVGGSAITEERDRLKLRTGDGPEKDVAAAAAEVPENDPITYLVAVVRGRLRPSGPSSLDNNLIVSEILDAARRSAAAGQTITLPAEAPRR